MSFLDGKNQENRIGHKPPGKDEKCLRCGNKPASAGLEYCVAHGREYAISIGARVETKAVMAKKKGGRPKGAKDAYQRQEKRDHGRSHPRRKLSKEDKDAIREYVSAGGKQKDMAEKYGVSAPHISNICARRA